MSNKENMLPIPSDESPHDQAVRLIDGRAYIEADASGDVVFSDGRLQRASKALTGMVAYITHLTPDEWDEVSAILQADFDALANARTGTVATSGRKGLR
jgi:hypothetical protein